MTDAPSPAPDAAAAASNNPPHFKVGLGFVKAYYRALTENPDALVNFYKAGTSYLGHGQGSMVADPKPLEEYDLSVAARWGCSSSDDNNNETTTKLRFDFEHGAIDTQPVNGGVLLVVTAQVFFDKHGSSTKDSECKDFVQTFFLVGQGRSFACYNDVLRFLDFPEGKKTKTSTSTATTTTTTAGTNTTTTTTADVGVETEPPEEKKTAEVKQHHVVEVVSRDDGEISTEATPALTDEAPGGGVEESKEEAPEEEYEPAPAPAKDGKGKRGNKSGGKQQEEKQQPAAAAKAPTPGSWASLVASGGSAPNTPSRKSSSDKPAEDAAVDVAVAEKTESKAPTPNNATTTTTTKPVTQEDASPAPSNGGATKPPVKGQQQPPFQQRPKRDPDNTLVIKNLSDNIKEQDIINMFKPFAMATNAKIVGTNLNHHRGLAFVDYDQVAPVLAALQKHQETPLQWNGKVLEVDQKSQEVKARRKDNNNNGFRGGGGGRDSSRRGDRGRGGRGSRGRGRGGR